MALDDESWWIREFEPPTLAKLTADLRTRYGVSRSLIGCKGDVNHLRGYHRSREWILNSPYSRDGAGDYSVQATLDKTGDARWLCAMDLQTKAGVPELIEICRRLDVAVRADRLPQIREWYGNADGDKIVDGWDNLRDRAASSDSSHLWHLHVSFFRSRANWDHSLLFDVITGDDMAFRDDADARALIWRTYGVLAMQDTVDNHVNNPAEPNELARAIRGIAAELTAARAELAELKARPVVELSDAQLDVLADRLAARIGKPATPEEIAVAVAVEDHRRSES